MTTDDMRAAMGMSAAVPEADVIAAYTAMTAGFAAASPAVEIATLDEVKDYLRVLGNHEDDTIILLLEAATEEVMAYADGWDGQEPVPARLKLAVLHHVTTAYRFRGDHEEALPTKQTARLISQFRKLDI